MGTSIVPAINTAARPITDRLPSWKRSAIPLLTRHISDPAVSSASTTSASPSTVSRKPALKLSLFDVPNTREPGSHWSPDTESSAYSTSSANLFEQSFTTRSIEVPKVSSVQYQAWQTNVTPRSTLRQDTTHIDEEFEAGKAEICHARMVASDSARLMKHQTNVSGTTNTL